MANDNDDNVFNFVSRGEREEHEAKLLRDEGLRLIAAYRLIGDEKARALVIRLTETLADRKV